MNSDDGRGDVRTGMELWEALNATLEHHVPSVAELEGLYGHQHAPDAPTVEEQDAEASSDGVPGEPT